jgi:hypothetical protein
MEEQVSYITAARRWSYGKKIWMSWLTLHSLRHVGHRLSFCVGRGWVTQADVSDTIQTLERPIATHMINGSLPGGLSSQQLLARLERMV